MERFELRTDGSRIILNSLGLFFLRFIASGAQRKRLRHIPSVFGVLANRYARPGKERKFTENLWYGMWHLFSFTMCVVNTFKSDWFDAVLKNDITYQWVHYDAPMDVFARSWFMLQCSFWLSCIMYSSLETWRSDSLQLILHHIVTVALITLGHFSGMWQLGLFTMILHDLSDILLYWAKTLSYTFAPSYITDFTFSCFALSFFLTRNVLFPYCVIRPVIYGTFIPREANGLTHSVFDDNSWRSPIILGVFLLLCLETMHIFWMYLIVKLANRLMNTSSKSNKDSGIQDIRSDDEDDREIGKKKTNSSHSPSTKGKTHSQNEYKEDDIEKKASNCGDTATNKDTIEDSLLNKENRNDCILNSNPAASCSSSDSGDEELVNLNTKSRKRKNNVDSLYNPEHSQAISSFVAA